VIPDPSKSEHIASVITFILTPNISFPVAHLYSTSGSTISSSCLGPSENSKLEQPGYQNSSLPRSQASTSPQQEVNRRSSWRRYRAAQIERTAGLTDFFRTLLTTQRRFAQSCQRDIRESTRRLRSSDDEVRRLWMRVVPSGRRDQYHE